MSSLHTPRLRDATDIRQIALGWRIRVLNIVLRIGAALGLLALLGGSWADLRANGAAAMPHVVAYAAIYGLIAFAAFVHKIGFTARAILLLAFAASMSTLFLALGGLGGPGRILFIGFVVSATLFLGHRGGVAAIGVMAIIMIIIAGLIDQGLLESSTQWQANIDTRLLWASALIVQLIVVSIATASFSFLFRQMTTLAVSAVESASQAEGSSRLAEERADALEAQAICLLATEQQLRDLVHALETPAVQLADGVLLVPLVGVIDQARVDTLLCRLLKTVSEGRTHLMIIDIAGVPAVDGRVAAVLFQITEALRLLGCETVITGINPDVATTLVSLNARMDGIMTARSPQDALALNLQGA
ncbi:STAS domain-containing protein [Oscillochloris sp. ZM17-4]|uniref:STAS domain-containing protein n=1 Tax=Oscillochloris sp. ZM17-4 TaxID=2866714 RepID=UPI001C72A245|nr:STAS domain-containing protein [Oscillochloris sp. ZM17-4]MBX0329572.1 STAS domain-containing protein [Oscillochloris sp. ZM17-4]